MKEEAHKEICACISLIEGIERPLFALLEHGSWPTPPLLHFLSNCGVIGFVALQFLSTQALGQLS